MQSKPNELSERLKQNSELERGGSVASLQLCVRHRTPMQKVDAVRALTNRGLEGDRHAMPDSARQVLLLDEELLRAYDVPAGALRENITTRGLDLMSLPQGTRLKIGQALFETTKECEPCSMVDGVRMGLREELAHKRGMLARVLQGGEIRVGDTIEIVRE